MNLIEAIQFLLDVRNTKSLHYDSVDINRAYAALTEFILVMDHVDSQRK